MYVWSGVRTLSREKSVVEKKSIFDIVMARFRDGAAAGERSGMGAELRNNVFVFGEKMPLP